MEAYLDFALFSMLNIASVQWPEGLIGVNISNYIAYVLFGLVIAVPLLLCTIAIYKRKSWQDDEGFGNKYGAFLSGTRTDKPGHYIPVLIFSMVFFVRRLLLSLTLVFWMEFFWGQVALQFGLSTMLIIVIHWTRPLDSDFATRMETFNECTNMVVLYMLMLFSDFVDKPETRSQIGLLYIGVIICFALVHMVFIFGDTFKKIYRKLKT